MKKLFKFRYPKLLGLIVAIILAYIIFNNNFVKEFILVLGHLNYLGDFIGGLLFSFGFTSPFSAGFFIVSNPSNIFLAAIIGGLGALISDLTIFKIIKFTFMDEFIRLEKTKTIKEINYLFEKEFGHKIKIYLLYAFAGILIASPLSDEIGIIMLAGLSKIRIQYLTIISFVLNTVGIFILLNI